MNVITSQKFEQSLTKLPERIVERVVVKTIIFKKDPFDSSLNTHKLHGRLKNQWSFSIDRKIRVLFEFINKSDILFLDVDNHDIYR